MTEVPLKQRSRYDSLEGLDLEKLSSQNKCESPSIKTSAADSKQISEKCETGNFKQALTESKKDSQFEHECVFRSISTGSRAIQESHSCSEIARKIQKLDKLQRWRSTNDNATNEEALHCKLDNSDSRSKRHKRLSLDVDCGGRHSPRGYRARSLSPCNESNRRKTPLTRNKNVLKPVAENLSSLLRKKVKRRNDRSLEKSLKCKRSPSWKHSGRTKQLPLRQNSDTPLSPRALPTSPRASCKGSASPSKPPPVSLHGIVSKSPQKCGKSVSFRNKQSVSQQTPQPSIKKKRKEPSLKPPVCKTVKVKLVSPEYVFPDRLEGLPLVRIKPKSNTIKNEIKQKNSSQTVTKYTFDSTGGHQRPASACQLKSPKDTLNKFATKLADSETSIQGRIKRPSGECCELGNFRDTKLAVHEWLDCHSKGNTKLRKNVCRNNSGLQQELTCPKQKYNGDEENGSYYSSSLEDDPDTNLPGEEECNSEFPTSPPSGTNSVTTEQESHQEDSGMNYEYKNEIKTEGYGEGNESSNDKSKFEVNGRCASEDNITVRAGKMQAEDTEEDKETSYTEFEETCDSNNFLVGPRNPLESHSDSSHFSTSESMSGSSTDLSDPEIRPAQADAVSEVIPANQTAREPIDIHETPIVPTSSGSNKCQSDDEPRLTVRQIVKCLHDKMSSSDLSRSSNSEEGGLKSNKNQPPPKRILQEWLPCALDSGPGTNGADSRDAAKPGGASENQFLASSEKKPTPTPRKSTNRGENSTTATEHVSDTVRDNGKAFENPSDPDNNPENAEGSEVLVAKEKAVFTKRELLQKSTGNEENHEEGLHNDSFREENATTAGLASIDTQTVLESDELRNNSIDVITEHLIWVGSDKAQNGRETFVNCSAYSSDYLSKEPKEQMNAAFDSSRVQNSTESNWAEALERAKSALKKIRSRSLSPSQVGAKINWLVEKGKTSLNKVIKSWSNTDTTEVTASPIPDNVVLSQEFNFELHDMSDVSEPLAGSSRGSPPTNSDTETQGDSLPPIYCLRINSPSLSSKRRSGSETNPHRGFSTGASNSSNSPASCSTIKEDLTRSSEHERDNMCRAEITPLITPDKINPSTLSKKPDKTTLSPPQLPKCEPAPHATLACPVALNSIKTRSPTLESILETDSVSESGGFTPACKSCGCDEDRSESMCVDELPQDHLGDTDKDKFANGEQGNTKEIISKKHDLEISETKPEKKTVKNALVLHPVDIPTRASHSDCSRECRHDLEQISGHEDTGALLSSAPLKTQSLVNTFDAVLSESGMTEMMALLSQEANIKRYPSYPDLTDLENDEDEETGDAAGVVSPGESFTAIQAMADLEVEENCSHKANNSTLFSNETCGVEDNAECKPVLSHGTERSIENKSGEVPQSHFSSNEVGLSAAEPKLEYSDDGIGRESVEVVGLGSPPRASVVSTSLGRFGEHHNSPQMGIREPEGKVGTIVSLIESCKVLVDSNSPPPPLYGTCANLDTLQSSHLTVDWNVKCDINVDENQDPGRKSECGSNIEGSSYSSKHFFDDLPQEVGADNIDDNTPEKDSSPHIILPSPPVESPYDMSEISDSSLLGSDMCNNTAEESAIKDNDRKLAKDDESLNTTTTNNPDDFWHGESHVMNSSKYKTNPEINMPEDGIDSLDKKGSPLCEHSIKEDIPTEVLNLPSCVVSSETSVHNEQPLSNCLNSQEVHAVYKAVQDSVKPEEKMGLNTTTMQCHNKEFKMTVEEQLTFNDIETKLPIGTMQEISLVTDDLLDSEEQDSSLTGIQGISGSSGAQTPVEKRSSDHRSNPHCLHNDAMDFKTVTQDQDFDKGETHDRCDGLEETLAPGKNAESTEQAEDVDADTSKHSSNYAINCSDVDCRNQGSSLDDDEDCDPSKVNFFPNEDSGCDLSLNSQSRSYRSFSTDEDKSSGGGETLPLPCDVELKKKKKKISKHMNSGEGQSPQPSKVFKVGAASSSRAVNGASGSNSRALSSQSSPDMNAAGGSNVTSAPHPRAPRAAIAHAKKSGGGGARHGRKEIKWDDEISFGDEEGLSNQSSSEMSSNRCNSCTSERSKDKGESCSQKKRSNSVCNSSTGLRPGERSRARRSSKRDKPYKSQVRRSPPPPGMASFNPRECLAKREACSLTIRVSRSLTTQVSSKNPVRSRSAHGDDIYCESQLKIQSGLSTLVPGGDVGSYKKLEPGKHLNIYTHKTGSVDSKEEEDEDLKAAQIKEEKHADKSIVSYRKTAFLNTQPGESKEAPKNKPSLSTERASEVFETKLHGEQALNNNHSSNNASLEEVNALLMSQLKFSAVQPQPIGKTPDSYADSLGMSNPEALNTGSLPPLNPTTWQQQQERQHLLQPGYPNSSSSTGDLRQFTSQVKENHEKHISRLARRVHSTDLGLARAYNFVSRSQLHLDRCDRLIERSSDIIRRSEEILATSRTQMEDTASALNLKRNK